jgi:hypothetical protein
MSEMLALPAVGPVGAVAMTSVSPYEGRIPPERLVSMVQRFHDAGLALVGLTDTLGSASPQKVVGSVGAVKVALPDIDRAAPARPVRRSAADCRCRLRHRRAPLRQRPGRLQGCSAIEPHAPDALRGADEPRRGSSGAVRDVAVGPAPGGHLISKPVPRHDSSAKTRKTIEAGKP